MAKTTKTEKTMDEVMKGGTPARAEVKGGVTPYLVVRNAGEAVPAGWEVEDDTHAADQGGGMPWS